MVEWPRPDPELVYGIDLVGLGEEGAEIMKKCFVQLEKDEDTQAFLDSCDPSTLRDSFASVLRTFMSRTDANGVAGRGKMFVLSPAQIEKIAPGVLLAAKDEEKRRRKLLDIGSGDGSITERFAQFFVEVVTTETSSVMADRLRARNWKCFQPGKQELPEPSSEDDLFDLITCFNVLDRCDKPVTLLRDLKRRLRPDGTLILAIVLPWCPFVEDGTKQKEPSELLPMQQACCKDGASFERSLEALIGRILIPEGFMIKSISRVPYISQGDSHQRFYVLSDAIIVCKL